MSLSHEETDELIHRLFKSRIIADVEEVHGHSHRLYFDNKEREDVNQENRILEGITADERIEEFGWILEDLEKGVKKTSEDLPSFNLMTIPIHSGHKDYLEWAIKETTKDANSLNFKPPIHTNSNAEAEEEEDKGKNAQDESKV